MNTAVDDEVNEKLAMEGPGRRLKALREAQELDIGRVATLLHLSPDKLEALEADDYQRLPGSVFTQGYIRNYARLLGVPVEPLLKAYHQTGVDDVAIPALKISQVRHEVHSSHFLVRLMTWIIVIGLIALVVVWWRGYLQWPPTNLGGFGGQTEQTEPVQDSDMLDDGLEEPESVTEQPVTEIDAGGEALLTLPAAPEAEPTPEPAAAVAPSVAGVAEPAASEAPEPVPAAVEDAAVSGGSPAAAVETIPETVPLPSGRVVIDFRDTSWTQVRDARGRLLFRGEMKGGSQRVLQGTAPYELVLGNASQVTVTVDGKPFDITPYIRGNVARLSLDPARIEDR